MSNTNPCPRCGSEVAIRWINGHRVPIRCACNLGPRRAAQEDKTFCRHLSCPHCHGAVFFVRHNGGSVWLDPPLGWPWPPHSCFVEDPASKGFARTFRDGPKTGDGRLCRVAGVHWQRSTQEQFVWLEDLERNITAWKTKDRNCEPRVHPLSALDKLRNLNKTRDRSYEPRVHSLVLFDIRSKTIRPENENTTFALSGPCERCKFCEDWCSADEMDAHVLLRHKTWTCPYCKETVEERRRREHEVVFGCSRGGFRSRSSR